MNRDDWIGAFARELGTAELTAQEIDRLLALAGVAAHASERTAAPLACYIAGRSGRGLEELHAAAARVNAGES